MRSVVGPFRRSQLIGRSILLRKSLITFVFRRPESFLDVIRAGSGCFELIIRSWASIIYRLLQGGEWTAVQSASVTTTRYLGSCRILSHHTSSSDSGLPICSDAGIGFGAARQWTGSDGLGKSVPGAGIRAGAAAAPSDGHRDADTRPRQLSDTTHQAEPVSASCQR